jgi:hypothetical protein
VFENYIDNKTIDHFLTDQFQKVCLPAMLPKLSKTRVYSAPSDDLDDETEIIDEYSEEE